MKISNSQFSKHSFNKVSGTFTETLVKSSNAFTKKVFKKGENAWGGDNTTETAYGAETPYGGLFTTYGETPYGGIDHFKLRTQPQINH